MDAASREAIAAIAARARTTLVVDETMADLWFDAPPPPPLAAFCPNGNVITLGSAGKSFWGGLRLGWIRAPARTIATLAQTRDTLDLGSPLLEQLATLWLIENGDTFLPARRQMLRARRDRCAALLREHFPEWGFQMPEGGLSYWVELPDMLATQLATRAEAAGIHLGPGTRFGLSGAFDRYLRMPFSLEPAELESALVRIKPLWLALNKSGQLLKRTLV
jgi:DNA-binding transcriptional MocR family regulator